MTSAVHMKFFLNDRSIPISSNNKHLVDRSYITPEDGYFLNHEGKVVVGDTLYTYNDTTYTKSNILNGTSEEVSTQIVLPDPGPGDGGGGGGGSPPGPCDGYNEPYGVKFSGDQYRIDQVVTDAFGIEWDVELTYGNASYTEIVRRSKTFTRFSFREHDPDNQGHFYEGNYKVWYYPPDLPQFASDRFPNSFVDANMEIESRIGLQLTCRTRTRGDEGEFKAERTKGRCPNTGVISWHNANLGPQVFLNNVCVNNVCVK